MMQKLEVTDEFLIKKMQKLLKKEAANKNVEIGKLYNINKWTTELLKHNKSKQLETTYEEFSDVFGTRIKHFIKKLKRLRIRMQQIINKKNADPFYKLSLDDLKEIDYHMAIIVYEITDVYRRYPTIDDIFIKTYFTLQDKCRDEFHWIDKKRLEKK